MGRYAGPATQGGSPMSRLVVPLEILEYCVRV